MALMWAIADCNRYIYYAFKNDLTAGLRYNLFIILYPAGVTGEMFVINDYIKRNADWLELQHINFIRFVQGSIIVGMLMLYVYMLSSRSKYYRNLRKQREAEKVEAKQD